MQSCSATANTYFFCIFNVICAAFKAHLFSTSAWGFILFLWVFYGRDLGWGVAGGGCLRVVRARMMNWSATLSAASPGTPNC